MQPHLISPWVVATMQVVGRYRWKDMLPKGPLRVLAMVRARGQVLACRSQRCCPVAPLLWSQGGMGGEVARCTSKLRRVVHRDQTRRR